MPSVLVIGGGVGGLTAAHELVDRGYAVTLFESRPTIGGKARSQPVAGTGTGGRQDLPGEHGFRFYPRFYRHVIDLMQRAPRRTAALTGLDRLDDLLDRVRPTDLVRRLLARLGVG